MKTTDASKDIAHSRAVNPYTPEQLATVPPVRVADVHGPRRRTILTGRYSVAGQGRMLAGVTHKAIQSYLSDDWDKVTTAERESLHRLLPDLEALCGFSPEGPKTVALTRERWGAGERYCPTGGMPVGWMVQISHRLSVWLAPISAAHTEEGEDDDEVTLSHWTQAVRHLIRTGHDLYLGPFSRAGRRKDQLMTIAQAASKNGARIRTAEYKFDWRPENPDIAGINDLLWTQFAQMQENEWRAILERTFAGRVLALSDGRLPTHKPCWGWTRDPQTDKPILDTEAVGVLRAALKAAAEFGPDQVDELFDVWHGLGVAPRRQQPRDDGRTILDTAHPYRTRYVRSRLANLITWETGIWRWYAPTVLTDLELVHGIELLPDVNDPRRRIVWFDIRHPLPDDGPIVEPAVAARIRELWEPRACGSCYDCLRRRWCQGNSGQTRNEWFGFLSNWSDTEEGLDYRVTFRADSGDREPAVTVLSRRSGSDAVWTQYKKRIPSADREARILSGEFCARLSSAILATASHMVTPVRAGSEQSPEMERARSRQRELTNDLAQLRAPLSVLNGDARDAVLAAIRPQVEDKERELSDLDELLKGVDPSVTALEADITGLVTTLDVLASGDLKTPQRTTALVRATVRDIRAVVATDQQTVTFQASLAIPNRRGTELVLAESISWTCANNSAEALVVRSKDRESELVDRVLRRGESVTVAAAAMGLSSGTAINKLSVVLREVMPNVQARGAIAKTPFLPSRRLVADMLAGRTPEGPDWLIDAVENGYCGAVGGGVRCPSTWVARGHAWRRELHQYVLRAGRPVPARELAAVEWQTFEWSRSKRDQARHEHASWPGFLITDDSGEDGGMLDSYSVRPCPHCRLPYDLLLNVPELPSPLVCTRCRTCGDETFELPDELLLPWDLDPGADIPTIVELTAPQMLVVAS